MSKIFNTNSEIKQMVQDNFGHTENYLVAMKHNGFIKGLLKLLINNLFYIMDSTRQFILYFDNQGIHEKEFSFTDKSKFLLIPWNEVDEFDINDKGNKIIINVNHLGKKYSYVVEFNDHLLKGNRERFTYLEKKNFFRDRL